jgi:hypothetical protein
VRPRFRARVDSADSGLCIPQLHARLWGYPLRPERGALSRSNVAFAERLESPSNELSRRRFLGYANFMTLRSIRGGISSAGQMIIGIADIRGTVGLVNAARVGCPA